MKITRKLTYLLGNIFKLPRFILDYYIFLNKNNYVKNKNLLEIKNILPILDEKTKQMSFDHHYVYHTAWAARVLKELNCNKHYDISSSIMFCSIISAFININHYDFRMPNIELQNLNIGEGNLLNLPFHNNSIDSLSCMHVIEHVGLGRYGDDIDPDGDLKAARELVRVLSQGGYLLIVVPMGAISKIRFNAHRIYSYDDIVSMFDQLSLIEFSFYNDNSGIFKRFSNLDDIFGSDYGCGCFLFQNIL